MRAKQRINKQTTTCWHLNLCSCRHHSKYDLCHRRRLISERIAARQHASRSARSNNYHFTGYVYWQVIVIHQAIFLFIYSLILSICYGYSKHSKQDCHHLRLLFISKVLIFCTTTSLDIYRLYSIIFFNTCPPINNLNTIFAFAIYDSVFSYIHYPLRYHPHEGYFYLILFWFDSQATNKFNGCVSRLGYFKVWTVTC